MGIENLELLFPGDAVSGIDSTIFTVINLGSGVFRVSGPDSMVVMVDSTHFQLDAPSVTDHGDGTYTAVSG